MKIVNIILTSQNGGAEQSFIDYLTVIKGLGHGVLAIVKDDAPYVEKIESLGIEVKKIKNSFGYYDIFAIKDIKEILEEFKADAVIAHVGRSIVLANKAIKKIKDKEVCLIAVNHSMNVRRSIGADYIFSVNKEAFHRTIDLGQHFSKSFVIPNAIDLTDAITDIPQVNLQNKEQIIIGAMARIDDKKGLNHLIKAIKILEEKSSKNFKLKIAGSGPYQETLEKLVKSLNLENKVEFLGWIKDKKQFFAEIDIFCSPSYNETFGLVLLEAMKYGKPIIATNTDGSKEILHHEKDGLLVDLKAINDLENSLCDSIIRLANEPDLLNRMIDNSTKKLIDKFSYAALEQRIEDVLGRDS